MFTPPPSPPVESSPSDAQSLQTAHFSCTHTMPSSAPLTRSRRKPISTLRWTIILVPIILVLITVITRFIAHPAVFDTFSPTSNLGWRSWSSSLTNWSLHEKHKSIGSPLQPVMLSDTISSPYVKRSPAATPAPTVPANPTLPTPFPQPYDTTLSSNFSTTSCYNFFLNMTQTDALRTCRPFSLLLTHSQAFITDQNNIDAINTDIWGTCNAGTSQSQCQLNMAWFASTLRSSCAADLGEQNLLAVNALIGLQAFDLMREAACAVDPVVNAYCFVEAVGSPDPSSYYFYQLPLGQPLPKITNGACNSCTKSLMSMYSTALSSSNASHLTGLQSTYVDAANALNTECGSTYAQTTTVATSLALPNARLASMEATWAVLVGTGMLWTWVW